jgi:AraC-like DNA-binding protein
MKYTQKELETRSQILLDGISQNLSYKKIASQLGINRGSLLRDIGNMRRSRDPDLLEARRIGQAKTKVEKQFNSQILDEKFHDMTGMTFHEKSFQNMVNFFKPELMTILRSGDLEAAIRKLPKSTRRTMIHNNILKKRSSTEITEKALNQLGYSL